MCDAAGERVVAEEGVGGRRASVAVRRQRHYRLSHSVHTKLTAAFYYTRNIKEATLRGYFDLMSRCRQLVYDLMDHPVYFSSSHMPLLLVAVFPTYITHIF